MKSILVPTDFSDCADNALDAAFQFSERFGSVIHLFTHIKLPVDWDALSPEEQKKRSFIWNKINKAEAAFKQITDRHPGFRIETNYSGGNLAQAIESYIQTHGIDLTIIGSHGASGKNEFFIGSNTQRVVRSVHCPVLVVKNRLVDIEFDRVVFASSFNENDIGAFLRFKSFVKPFLPEIHLVAIQTSSIFDPPYILSKAAMERFRELCSPFSCETHVYKDLNIDKGIRTFSEDIGAKLIGISNHMRHPLKRMLVGSNVEALVNHADVPVLSIDYQDVHQTISA